MLFNVHLHTLLFLHISEIFKRESPHRRSPESIGLHDRLQASPDRDIQKERFQKKLRNRKTKGKRDK